VTPSTKLHYLGKRFQYKMTLIVKSGGAPLKI
jgi:hypothetical protein